MKITSLSDDAGVSVLILSGTVGAGKSTVLDEIHTLLSDAHLPHICVDADALALSWPHRGAFNQVAVLEHIASLWQNARRTGAQRCVIATVIESGDDLDAYRNAIPSADVVLVQLTASEATRLARLRNRERGAQLEWHLERTVVLQRILDDAFLHNFAVANDGRLPREVAFDVLTHAGWPVAPCADRPHST